MKLSMLHEEENLAQQILGAPTAAGGSPWGRYQFKKAQDPMRPGVQGQRTDQPQDTKGSPTLPYRSGNQKGTVTNPRHRKFFGDPNSGRSDAIRPDDQMAIGGGETRVWLGPGGYGSSLRKR